MRLLLDECVSSRATAEALAGDGIEVLRATQVMPAGSLDEDLIAWCGREDAYLLTADTFRRGGALEHRLIRATVIQFRVGVFVYHARADDFATRVAVLQRQRRRLLQAHRDFARRRPFFASFSRSKPRFRYEFLRGSDR